jgi:hypothetical protein
VGEAEQAEKSLERRRMADPLDEGRGSVGGGRGGMTKGSVGVEAMRGPVRWRKRLRQRP